MLKSIAIKYGWTKYGEPLVMTLHNKLSIWRSPQINTSYLHKNQAKSSQSTKVICYRLILYTIFLMMYIYMLITSFIAFVESNTIGLEGDRTGHLWWSPIGLELEAEGGFESYWSIISITSILFRVKLPKKYRTFRFVPILEWTFKNFQ